MKQLTNFTIEIRETDFVLRLTDEDGEVVEFASSAEQLDRAIDAFNDLMAEAEED
jgi:polyribonucleotide nucleotidyltransferase